MGYPAFGMGTFTRRTLTSLGGHEVMCRPARASAYTPINRGDVLFPTSGETIEDIGKSAVNLMHTQVLCGGDLIIFRSTIPMEPKFAGYALDCNSAQTQKSLMGRGITIMHVYSAQLKYLRLPLPPLSEQAAIVHYLDHVDRRIRRYVVAKRKAGRAAGGGEAGRRQSSRHPRPRSQRPPQALRHRVARRRAGALGTVKRLGNRSVQLSRGEINADGHIEEVLILFAEIEASIPYADKAKLNRGSIRSTEDRLPGTRS